MLVVDYRQGRLRASGYVGVGTEWVRLQSWCREVALAAPFATAKDSRFPSTGSGQALTGLSVLFGMTRLYDWIGKADSGTGKGFGAFQLCFSGLDEAVLPSPA